MTTQPRDPYEDKNRAYDQLPAAVHEAVQRLQYGTGRGGHTHPLDIVNNITRRCEGDDNAKLAFLQEVVDVSNKVRNGTIVVADIVAMYSPHCSRSDGRGR